MAFSSRRFIDNKSLSAFSSLWFISYFSFYMISINLVFSICNSTNAFDTSNLSSSLFINSPYNDAFSFTKSLYFSLKADSF
jgi:hypothetical protein